ncbi:hypothetical protein CcI156_21545 [Frankia sp. CcI156]|jgi:FtsP/CotA-like multicopper oxidase with cupredoxin domain|nr:hypothetical protein CcI6DRAFT_03592 [Frankia sp. CcI6]EYT90620.1 hypothetical protein ThrDRAFT_03725 [Frankia casuarinae]KFB02773.1 hypothetical protein ALLO2DRAFT_04490 [Frankia sp. Allo2]OFB39684.1 hypothetical protein Manayef4_20380 [Frankia sp. CgIM4]ONH22345.1 hypothetical protein CcI156_21545 [Frankia sp. CcI156]TFE24689.1 hypothetical protein E0F15_21110 [Frankia sp. B2]
MACGPSTEHQHKFHPATGQQLINGKSFDMDRIDIRPRLGRPEIWKITNADVNGLRKRDLSLIL